MYVSHHWNRPKGIVAQEKFDVKDDYKMQEICVGFEWISLKKS
jgi:hypothetical protein